MKFTCDALASRDDLSDYAGDCYAIRHSRKLAEGGRERACSYPLVGAVARAPLTVMTSPLGAGGGPGDRARIAAITGSKRAK